MIIRILSTGWQTCRACTVQFWSVITAITWAKQGGILCQPINIEFDHYNSSESYYGLDKLCLNNIIQDNTYMKDYLSYQLMGEAGVPSPLCSYANIFDNAKTAITKGDKTRLIESLKSLSANENIEEVVNVDEVIRYFVVHNFLCNEDSYTGSMIHNYYLYEEDGQISMIPWDYNLAFGGFQSQDATAEVNAPIDTPVSGGSMDDRPMVAWIFEDEAYTQLYHQYFNEFLEQVDFSQMIRETETLIAPYVEKDPTKFCTYEEFETGVDALEQFCKLRVQSVQGQLDGTIPSTTDGQSAEDAELIDASGLNLSDMGSMGNGMKGGGQPGGRGNGDF
ncbi:MAG: CotH kinase family protein [Lachnospiraceae bacterium]|nr:CotH kinase family protein [Lachnospiraceae bacterium]